MGSSPRLRGTLNGLWQSTTTGGIIPALAGNTPRRPRPIPTSRDHPRACGEHSRESRNLAARVGSSPRLRGTREPPQRLIVELGIIPALAGNTKPDAKRPSKYWDHPRACGEHLTITGYIALTVGSSPRLRGTPQALFDAGLFCWIIPALAGNTLSLTSAPQTRRDHPRACGEHSAASIRHTRSPGSSPRLRGTRGRALRKSHRSGIIPALAGNTDEAARGEFQTGDHPRACGEHMAMDAMNDSWEGSSPRLRGTHTATRDMPESFGIIPALAGNTGVPGVHAVRAGDHPRACGEHTMKSQ